MVRVPHSGLPDSTFSEVSFIYFHIENVPVTMTSCQLQNPGYFSQNLVEYPALLLVVVIWVPIWILGPVSSSSNSCSP